jgi:ribosome-binding protein aMBF1 (putative translation factor)
MRKDLTNSGIERQNILNSRKKMKNKKLEERRNKISKEIDVFVKQSFDIVDRIHEILVAQGKEQKELATLLGKSESEISKWMTGTHNFTIKTLSKIESILGEKIILTVKDKVEEKSFV